MIKWLRKLFKRKQKYAHIEKSIEKRWDNEKK